MVRWNEFITVHLTFSVLNAWISYNVVYILFINVVNLCNYDTITKRFISDNIDYVPGQAYNFDNISYFCKSSLLTNLLDGTVLT